MRLFFALLSIAAAAAAQNASYEIATVAGSDWVGDNGAATSALLFQAEGIASDVYGNLYVVDAAEHRVRKVTPSGVITTIAGTGLAGFSGDGGPAMAAQLNSPYGIALDGAGNLYVADLGNARIRRIGPDGTIVTIAGGGSLTAGGVNEGSLATMVSLNAPRNIAADRRGGIYFSDFNANCVYYIAVDGSLTTAVGNGTPQKTFLSFPTAIAVDSQGSLYVADSQGHRILRFSNGVVSTLAQAVLPTGLVVDTLGTLWIADSGTGQVIEVGSNGVVTAYNMSVTDLCEGADGYLYATSGTTVLRLSFTATSSVVAGGGNTAHGDGGPANEARLLHPSGVNVDAAGNFYIADRDNNRIRKVGPDGTITTVAATGVTLKSPSSVMVDAKGNLYVADTGNAIVRVIGTNGVQTLPVAGLVSPVYALSDGSGNVYVADSGAGRIFHYNPASGTSIAVTNLYSPRGMALDASGNLYFTEAAGKHVKKLDPSGNVTSFGEGGWGQPEGIAIDADGNLFVADAALQSVVRVDGTGRLTVVAGNGIGGFAGDGRVALSAELDFPWDVAIAASGAVYAADLGNSRVRELTAAQSAVSVTPPNTIIGVVNAASLQAGPVAPGMLVEITGTGLGPNDAANTQVLFGGAAAQILSIDAAGILVQAPAQFATQPSAVVQVVDSGNLLAQTQVTLAASAPALFTNGAGQALADNQDGSVNSPPNAAAPGSVIVLYGTGEGVSGQPATVTIGGIPAEVLYAGEIAAYPGLLQINARIPSGYVAPGNMSVVVNVGLASSQAGVSISVN